MDTGRILVASNKMSFPFHVQRKPLTRGARPSCDQSSQPTARSRCWFKASYWPCNFRRSSSNRYGIVGEAAILRVGVKQHVGRGIVGRRSRRPGRLEGTPILSSHGHGGWNWQGLALTHSKSFLSDQPPRPDESAKEARTQNSVGLECCHVPRTTAGSA